MASRSRTLAACCIVSQSDFPGRGCEDRAILEAGPVHTSTPADRPHSVPGNWSGDDIGQQLALDLRDLILEQQLSLLQALQLQLVERSALGEPRDHIVEVAMLGF